MGHIVQPVLQGRIGTSEVLPRDAHFCSVLKTNKIMQNPFADDKKQGIFFFCLFVCFHLSWDSLGTLDLLLLLVVGREQGKALRMLPV